MYIYTVPHILLYTEGMKVHIFVLWELDNVTTKWSTQGFGAPPPLLSSDLELLFEIIQQWRKAQPNCS